MRVVVWACSLKKLISRAHFLHKDWERTYIFSFTINKIIIIGPRGAEARFGPWQPLL